MSNTTKIFLTSIGTWFLDAFFLQLGSQILHERVGFPSFTYWECLVLPWIVGIPLAHGIRFWAYYRCWLEEHKRREESNEQIVRIEVQDATR